ncbi:MAG: hypothetical protein QY318_03475 [Candidatus Dojkabacteria bacterium]|nr:MAG: hypothetical protein QY318_03475 [Candidatus Dojkabacteria bacterium]
MTKNQKLLKELYGITPKDFKSLIPNDLVHLVSEMHIVKRYVSPGYIPEGLIKDNLYMHLERLIILATEIYIPPMDGDTLTRTLWVHDVGEMGKANDVINVEKSDKPNRRVNEKMSEEVVAKGMLSEEDYKLLLQFRQVSDSFEKEVPVNVSKEFVVAKVLDFIENPIDFFYWYTKWIRKGNVYDGITPPKVLFTYTLLQTKKVWSSINGSDSISEEIKVYCLSLLCLQIDGILRLWDEVPENQIPRPMADELKQMSHFLMEHDKRILTRGFLFSTH